MRRLLLSECAFNRFDDCYAHILALWQLTPFFQTCSHLSCSSSLCLHVCVRASWPTFLYSSTYYFGSLENSLHFIQIGWISIFFLFIILPLISFYMFNARLSSVVGLFFISAVFIVFILCTVLIVCFASKWN